MRNSRAGLVDIPNIIFIARRSLSINLHTETNDDVVR